MKSVLKFKRHLLFSTIIIFLFMGHILGGIGLVIIGSTWGLGTLAFFLKPHLNIHLLEMMGMILLWFAAIFCFMFSIFTKIFNIFTYNY